MRNQISNAIYALEIERDNAVAWDLGGHVREETAQDLVHRAYDRVYAPNHAREIDARIQDDLRKLSSHVAAFRAAAVEYGVKRHTQLSTDEFKRLRRQMIETARDIRFTLSHIDPDCGR